MFVGARTDDEFGRTAAGLLKAEGVNTRFFSKKKDANSGVALIFVGGREKQNMIAVAKSANDQLTVADIRRAEAMIAKAKVVVTQLEIPLTAVQEAACLSAKHQVPFILNPAPAQKLPRSLLKLTTLITPNENEAKLLTGATSSRLAARELIRLGCKNVAVTLGAKGLLLVSKDGEDLIQAPRVRAVDTVGAGDCLTGWLAALMARGMPLCKAAELAVRAASLSVTRKGALDGMPYRNEIE